MQFFGSFNEEKSLDFRRGFGYCCEKGREKALTTVGGNHAMKSIISELYSGNIFPAETDMPTDSKYRTNMGKVGREIEELQKVLTGEQYDKLEHMLDMNAEVIKMQRGVSMLQMIFSVRWSRKSLWIRESSPGYRRYRLMTSLRTSCQPQLL